MIALRTFDLIIWDLDGTLLDSFGAHADIVTQVWRKHGLPVPDYNTMQHHFHGKLRDSISGLAGDIGEDKIDELLEDFLQIDNVYMKNVDDHLFSDAVELAKKARDAEIQQVLVTNRAHGKDRGNASPRAIVRNSELFNCIDVVLCGDEVMFRKPDPRVFNEIELTINPKRTLVIGDQFVDAQFAHNIGTSSVIVRRDGSAIPHLNTLHNEIHAGISLVKDLGNVVI